jgi:hypothetical protein
VNTALKHQKEKRSMDHFAGLDVSAVRQLKAEHSRAEEIVRALESEREFGVRLH